MNATAKFLLEHNKVTSAEFDSPDARAKRLLYQAEHPTRIAVLKCMDGRLNVPVICDIEPGIFQPFRNIGGKFDLGFPHFGDVFQRWAEYSLHASRTTSIALDTYHYSKGDHHRGCAGHEYDTAAAERGAVELREQTERVFGQGHAMVYPIVVGIETDEDTLVFHGNQEGQKLDLTTMLDAPLTKLEQSVVDLYPDMQERNARDLMPLITGNIKHIAKLRSSVREPLDIEHREQIIAIGRGFDWLHLINKALIVGPYSPDLASPIGVAGKVIRGNMEAGRIDVSEGLVLMSSAIHREGGWEKNRAVEKARSMARLGYQAVSAMAPELLPHLQVIAGTLDENNRLFTQVEFEPAKAKAAASPVAAKVAAH